jgi:hypothetical protein
LAKIASCIDVKYDPLVKTLCEPIEHHLGFRKSCIYNTHHLAELAISAENGVFTEESNMPSKNIFLPPASNGYIAQYLLSRQREMELGSLLIGRYVGLGQFKRSILPGPHIPRRTGRTLHGPFIQQEISFYKIKQPYGQTGKW